MKMISVIIPVYKVEKYIVDCVKSVLSQESKNIEIILVDDGSPDASPSICDRLQKEDARIRVIHQSNSGVSAARKAGSDIARGEYLLFLDGDDWLAPTCLSTLEKIISENNVDIVCFGMYYGDGKKYNKYPFSCKYGYYTQSDIVETIYPVLLQKKDASYFPASLCGKIIKRELFDKNALVDRRCVIGEDYACVIPCVFYSKTMLVLEECLYYYRYNYESATKGKNVFPLECPEIIYNHINNLIDLKMYDFTDQMYRKVTHDIFNVVLSQFNRKDSYRVIVNDIKRNLKKKLYSDAIDKSKFSDSLMAKLMKFSLKHRCYFLIYIYSKVKKMCK